MSSFLTIEEAIEIFEMSIYNQNLSDGTIYEYMKELKKLQEFLDEKDVRHLEEVKTIDIERYFALMVRRNVKANTRNRTRSVLNSFFENMKKRGELKNNPIDAISSIKIKETELKENPPLSSKEIEKMKENMLKKSRYPEKNVAIVDLLGICGLRVGELVQQKWEDLDEKERSLQVKGKGGKIRYVPIFDDIYENLMKLKKSQPNDCEYIINYKNENKPVSTRSVFDTIERYAKMSKLKDTVGCHTLRASSATNFLLADVNVKFIQMLLGHSDISTTSRYLRPMDKEMEKALKSAKLK